MINEHIAEPIECRTCGIEFDLARMNYYDNLCPKCKGGDYSIWVSDDE